MPVVVSLGTGLRKSELLSLKVGEINFGQLPIFYRVNDRDLTIRPGCLLVAKSKNKETRVIPMNQEVHEALKAVVADAPAVDSVFTFSRNGVSTATKTLSVMANYAHGTPEAMRGAVNQLRGTPARVVEFRAAG